MYTHEKKEQVRKFKKNSTSLGRFILDKGASPKINFSDNKTKRFWGTVLRKGVANWGISWLTPKEQGLYAKIYDIKPWFPAVQGTFYNIAVTGYLIGKGMESSSDLTVNALLGGFYGMYLIQQVPRAIISVIENKGYPPQTIGTLGANSITYAKRFRDNYHKIIEGLSSTAQAQGIIDPLAPSKDRENENNAGEDEENKNNQDFSLEDKIKSI